MELQWSQSNCTFLQRDLWEVQNLEQTQDVRLTDGMPDVGRVVCAWGQPVLRSKEWRNDAVVVAGGVITWTLYAPEDGSELRCVEAWLPFQAKWSLPDSRREGTLRICCCLRSVDARTLSSRKIMVRASVGLLAEALEPAEESVSQPGELPEGVQVLSKTYPAVLPKEAGEKQFAVEEDITVEGPQKILCCQVDPEVTEQNVIGGRAVFRGKCHVKLLYLTEAGRILSFKSEIPFAQYAELDRDYDKDAELSVMMALSAAEPEITENGVHLKCGMIAQYVVYDREMITVAEDAYSPYQSVKPVQEILRLPMVLDRTTHDMEASGQLQADGAEVVDVTFLPDHPTQFREENSVLSQLSGAFQVLYYDMEGQLQCRTESWSDEWKLPMEESSSACIHVSCVRVGDQGATADRIHFTAEANLEAVCVCRQGLPAISGLHLGERKEPDADRPSLILRRMGQESLWELAKKCGSTVDAICKANQLSGDPSPEQMLLIPIC